MDGPFCPELRGMDGPFCLELLLLLLLLLATSAAPAWDTDRSGPLLAETVFLLLAGRSADPWAFLATKAGLPRVMGLQSRPWRRLFVQMCICCLKQCFTLLPALGTHAADIETPECLPNPGAKERGKNAIAQPFLRTAPQYS